MESYFSFYDLPEAFIIDKKALKRKYIAMSKKYHPDFYTLDSSDTQEDILETSTFNNKAWKTLSNDMSRIAYLLDLKGAMPAEGEATVPQMFLMEMMDINEQLMELEMDPDPSLKEKVLGSIETIKNELATEGESAMLEWDNSQADTQLEIIRDYYLKSKYVQRILERVG